MGDQVDVILRPDRVLSENAVLASAVFSGITGPNPEVWGWLATRRPANRFLQNY
jgi:hypothetical protein